MRSRAAALALLALLVAGCDSRSSARVAPLPTDGPHGVLRVALADLLWPLDPTRARTRDEVTLARALFATPLRTDPNSGELRPGLCSTWRAEGSTWRFRCRQARTIAAHLRRAKMVPADSVSAPTARTLVIRSRDRDLPYRLTQIAAAPPAIPGPFRLISATSKRVVAERPGLRLEVRKLEPFTALRLFRAGRLDEAPVPLGDIRATKLDPQLRDAVRVRRVLGADVVVFQGLQKDLLSVYDDTADRADYQALVTEFEAPPAENLVDRGRPSASEAAIALREARKRIPSLAKIAVGFASPSDPVLAYGTNLLVAAWRDLGLGATFDNGSAGARLERLLAPYPRRQALTRLARGKIVVPIAWVADARLVSPRVRSWREDELGAVDYTRVRFRAASRSR